MHEGYQHDAWDKLSAMMCLIANIYAPKGKSFKPKDFNPMLSGEMMMDARDMKQIVTRMLERRR